MSTVLWANQLHGDEVISEERDRWALYKHTAKLDKLATAANLPPFSSLLDHTDLEINTGAAELPPGMESTDDLMASEGVWRSAEEAVALLNGLLATITAEQPRFGLVKNDYEQVVAELSETVEFARKALEHGAKFNLAVVM